MAVLNARIDGHVAGDSVQIDRTAGPIPLGRILSKAWFTVKVAPNDPDPGVLQKVVTATLSAAGQITDLGADGIGAATFLLTPADTLLLTVGQDYHYDVQTMLDDGKIVTGEVGKVKMLQGVTAAVS
jgi:hypothetical protein